MDSPVGSGPKKFRIDIEGTIHTWPKATITVPEIRELGQLPSDVPVQEIDENNNQRDLREDEVVTLRPGLGFTKKVRYQRG
jgi:hypothetical protein